MRASWKPKTIRGVEITKEFIVSTCQGDTFVEKVLSDPYPSRAPRVFTAR